MNDHRKLPVWRTILRTAAILAVIIMTALAGCFFYNRACLSKEARLIQHKGQYVEVDGGRMNLYIAGNGNCTLIIMAGSGCPSPVLEFLPLARRLENDCRTVIIEKFGYGYSDETEGERTVGVFLEQDRAAFREAGIPGPYILCPHSASGMEALYWAEKYPEEVLAIIGLDMALPAQYDLMGVDFHTLQPQVSGPSLMNFLVFQGGLMRFLYRAEDIFTAAGSEELTEAEREEYRAIMYTVYARGEGSAMMREQRLTARFIQEMQEIHDSPLPDLPVLLFVSDGKDMERAVKSTDNWLKIHEDWISRISSGKLVQLDCGHYVHIEDPDTVSAEIRSFLQALEQEEAE